MKDDFNSAQVNDKKAQERAQNTIHAHKTNTHTNTTRYIQTYTHTYCIPIRHVEEASNNTLPAIGDAPWI